VAAAHEELVRPRVMTAVEDLVAQEASGVLEITGKPSGAIYLDGGRIAFARASWVPSLTARLIADCPALAGTLAAAQPSGPAEPTPGRDSDEAAIAALAVQHGHLTPGALHELIGSVVVDAFLVLTMPVAADSAVAAIRFTSTRTYWTGIFPRFGLDLVRAEALRRAERMAEHGLAPTTPVALRDQRAPAAVITREQWALAWRIGEHAAALDLAMEQGAALSDTLDCLGSLAQAGLCAPVRVSRRTQHRTPARIAAVPAAEAVQAGLPGAGRLPARHPARFGQHAAGEHAPGEHRAARELSGAAGQAPPIDILRQVLTGLRKLG
jgi:hypothetical protein